MIDMQEPLIAEIPIDAIETEKKVRCYSHVSTEYDIKVSLIGQTKEHQLEQTIGWVDALWYPHIGELSFSEAKTLARVIGSRTDWMGTKDIDLLALLLMDEYKRYDLDSLLLFTGEKSFIDLRAQGIHKKVVSDLIDIYEMEGTVFIREDDDQNYWKDIGFELELHKDGGEWGQMGFVEEGSGFLVRKD